MDQTPKIAIIGLACRYPDAKSPQELWEQVLGRRRAFRRMPPERLRLEDYFSEDASSSDSIYSTEAALLTDYEFDRVRFRVGKGSFQVADLAHWLALDVASDALADAGFADCAGLPRNETGVLVGNSLTGEFSRAQLMRARWPYVRRQVAAALADEGWSREESGAFLGRFEARYKEPFPATNDESLAGGLANTIAGRIANHFDLHGGGYTVDGACASSLLAVSNACSALVAGDLEVALAGGVDLSLDPFELVGFARTGALARGDMRVFDRRPTGFIPGEGCGFAVLMRTEDAVARGRRIYAGIRGWGLSSDGAGGLTRPEAEGQTRALSRAYRRAGYGIDTVALFEGHGTGTAVGDGVELKALNLARRRAGSGRARGERMKAAIGSIKANIGHTKAAAGLAGLIKATLALQRQILPPATGCVDPHPEIIGEASTLRILDDAELWPQAAPLRAGVSAMGFGGINVHLALEATSTVRRQDFAASERRLLTAPQDAEVFFLEAADPAALRKRVKQLLPVAAALSRAELTDLASELASALSPSTGTEAGLPVRAAAVAAHPRQLAERLETLRDRLGEWAGDSAPYRLDHRQGIFFGRLSSPPRIGFMFPGQGSPSDPGGGLWRRRFAVVDAFYERSGVPRTEDGAKTRLTQSVIATAALSAVSVLERMGIAAASAVGHSLGEIVALHWGGALGAGALLRIVDARGRAMADFGDPQGAMASLGVGPARVEELLKGSEELCVASYNAPRQTVVSGPMAAIERTVREAHTRGWSATKLPVSRAFHSPLVAAAEPHLAKALDREIFNPLERPVASTITGEWLNGEDDLRALLRRQITAPVRFAGALRQLAREVDVLVEVGPGRILTRLAGRSTGVPAVAVDSGDTRLEGLLQTAGALFALGAPLDPAPLFEDRFYRPLDLSSPPRFLINPCELAPADDAPGTGAPAPVARRRLPPTHGERSAAGTHETVTVDAAPDPAGSELSSATATPDAPLPVVRRLLARQTELPPEAIAEDNQLLGDLHLSSIAVTELVTEAARQLELPPPVAPTEYANATVGDLAQALGELKATQGQSRVAEAAPAGLEDWVRPFVVDWVERPAPRGAGDVDFAWRVAGDPDHPLRAALEGALNRPPTRPPDDSGQGLALLLGEGDVTGHLDALLSAGQAAVRGRRGALLLVEPESSAGGAAFARSLHLEAPEVAVTVVTVPFTGTGEADLWAERIAAETRRSTGFAHARLDGEGRRRVPLVRLLPDLDEVDAAPLADDEVVLVSGGGKGIGAECALALARRYGARLAILGRSQPEDDPELAANLERLDSLAVTFRYLQADVCDSQAVAAAVARATHELGPVRAVLHSAGSNVPKLIEQLERGDVERTLAPKVTGLRNLLAAVDAPRLKLLVGFGSIIGRMGLRGEADYALANEVLRRTIEGFAYQHPACRALCLEWSVWSGVGMGARLADLDALTRDGIQPIPPEAGIEMLHRLLARPTPAAVIVAGRFGALPTLEVDRRELPLRRFLEKPRYDVPGVELVVDAELSAATDPYLEDHVYGGERLFPAVLGLEAMAQAGLALLGRTSAAGLAFRDVRFERPVTVPEDEHVTLRLAALARRAGEVEVALRSSRTAFRVDHFRATLVEDASQPAEPAAQAAGDAEVRLDLEPRDLYGPVLFQSGKFQRVRGYRRLRATECLAEIEEFAPADWFGSLLPATLELGDPGARDASIHAVQACIPHATVLPVAIERLALGPALASTDASHRTVFARERSCRDRTLVYDLEVRSPDSELVEHWQGLELRAVGDYRTAPSLAAPLLGPYLERRLGELLPHATLRVIVMRSGNGNRRELGDLAAELALNGSARIVRRPDGKPEAVPVNPAQVNGTSVSIAYGGDLVLAIAGRGALGCDVELVTHRSDETWRDLLGDRRELVDLLAAESDENQDALGTRLWSVIEGLKKAGATATAPLVYSHGTSDGWLLFSSGRHAATSVLLPLPGSGEQVSIVAIAEGDVASPGRSS